MKILHRYCRYILLMSVVALGFSCGNGSKKLDKLVAEAEKVEQQIREEVGDRVSVAQTDGLEIPVIGKGIPEVVLQRMGYTVSFNQKNNVPNWVAWELTPKRLVDNASRAKHFYPDPDFSRDVAVETKDYSNSGWDRGHMCPAGDNKWDKQAMKESFYMTNMCPQHHNLNRGDWKELEDDCRRWTEETNGAVYIACGPIFYKQNTARFIGNEHQVRVPDAFFKVVLKGVAQGRPQAIGFIYKNTAGNHPLDAYVNSVDEVERITGFDFFSALPDDIENEVEAKSDITLWR